MSPIPSIAQLTTKVHASPVANIYFSVLAGACIASYGVAELGLVSCALAQTEEASPVVGRHVHHWVTFQERAVGGIVDNATFGTAPVFLQELRIVVAGLQQVATLPVANLVKCRPAVQKDHQAVSTLPIWQAEFVAAVPIEETTEPPSAVEIDCWQAYLQQAIVWVLDMYETFWLNDSPIFAPIDFQLARRVEIWQLCFISVDLRWGKKRRKWNQWMSGYRRFMNSATEAYTILFLSFLLARKKQSSPMDSRQGSNTDAACLIDSEIQDACCWPVQRHLGLCYIKSCIRRVVGEDERPM